MLAVDLVCVAVDAEEVLLGTEVVSVGFYEGVDYLVLVIALFYLVVEVIEDVGLVGEGFVEVELESLKIGGMLRFSALSKGISWLKANSQ